MKERSKKEYHEHGFSGVYVPWYVLDLVEQGKLEAIDVLMLITISSFCGAEECSASATYLSRRVGVGERKAHTMISKLVQLGLVTSRRHADGTQTFRVVYDEPTEDKDPWDEQRKA